MTNFVFVSFVKTVTTFIKLPFKIFKLKKIRTEVDLRSWKKREERERRSSFKRKPKMSVLKFAHS